MLSASSAIAFILRRRKLELGEVTGPSQLGWQLTSSLHRAWLLFHSRMADFRSWTRAEQSPPHLLGFQFMRELQPCSFSLPSSQGCCTPSAFPHTSPHGHLLCAKYSGAWGATWRKSPHVQLPAQEEGRGEREAAPWAGGSGGPPLLSNPGPARHQVSERLQPHLLSEAQLSLLQAECLEGTSPIR